jgi:hypothetical protein
LEYTINPYDIEMYIRIYQSDQYFEYIADPEWIKEIMNKIKQFDKRIEQMKEVML